MLIAIVCVAQWLSAGCSYPTPDLLEEPRYMPPESVLHAPHVYDFYVALHQCDALQEFAEERAVDARYRNRMFALAGQLVAGIGAFVAAMVAFLFWRKSHEPTRDRWAAIIAAFFAFAASLTAAIQNNTGASPEDLDRAAHELDGHLFRAVVSHESLVDSAQSPSAGAQSLSAVARDARRALEPECVSARRQIRASAGDDAVKAVEHRVVEVLRTRFLSDRMTGSIDAELQRLMIQ